MWLAYRVTTIPGNLGLGYEPISAKLGCAELSSMDLRSKRRWLQTQPTGGLGQR
jgi:hypothetical protein